jgi:hypothetical protein
MSKIKDLKEQHPSLAVSILDVLKKIDPSGTGKYMHFLIKEMYVTAGGKSSIEDALATAVKTFMGKKNIEVLEQFEKYSKTQAIKVDITQVNDFNEMIAHVDYADEAERLKEMERQVHKWYMDDDWLVLTPVTFEASKMYGRGTKWCTTNELSWNTYKGGLLVYMINRKARKNAKFAVYIKNNKHTEYYDEEDEKLQDSIMLPISNEVRNTLVHIFTNFSAHSCERVFKHHSTEYILHSNGNYYEISKMPKTMLRTEIQRFEAISEPCEKDIERTRFMKELLAIAETKIQEKSSIPKKAVNYADNYKKKVGTLEISMDDHSNTLNHGCETAEADRANANGRFYSQSLIQKKALETANEMLKKAISDDHIDMFRHLYGM